MATIEIRREHTLAPERARAQAEELARSSPTGLEFEDSVKFGLG
jgi:hypothetical protein